MFSLTHLAVRWLMVGFTFLLAGSSNAWGDIELLNVSYDPTREFYKEFDQVFAEHWKKSTGEVVKVRQSHGGSGKQARAVIEGLNADVVTLALSFDIDNIAKRSRLLPGNWQTRLPAQSSPYTSTIVFLVRKGNPKSIRDWSDLVKPHVEIITPNPKTGGGARWNYLAAWGSILKSELGDLSALKDPAQSSRVDEAQKKARDFVSRLYANVSVLDTAARNSTNTFIQREMGDVLIAWENEAFLAVNELGPDKVEIVVPRTSILAQPPVSIVDQNVDRKGTRRVATAYLEHLYSPDGQRLAAKHFYRPLNPEHADPKDLERFPDVELFTIDQAFGGWQEAQQTHFADGGIYDQLDK